jgi:hypothetical protein
MDGQESGGGSNGNSCGRRISSTDIGTNPTEPATEFIIFTKSLDRKEAIIIAKEKESNGKGKSNLAWYKPVSLSIIFTISLRMILVRCVLSGIIFYMYDSFCYVTVAIVELNRERVVLRLLDS